MNNRDCWNTSFFPSSFNQIYNCQREDLNLFEESEKFKIFKTFLQVVISYRVLLQNQGNCDCFSKSIEDHVNSEY